MHRFSAKIWKVTTQRSGEMRLKSRAHILHSRCEPRLSEKKKSRDLQEYKQQLAAHVASYAVLGSNSQRRIVEGGCDLLLTNYQS